VYVNYLRDGGELESLRAELAEARGEIRGIQADLRSHSERRGMFEAIARESRRIDILVNNAAIFRKGFLISLTKRTGGHRSRST